ncbi:hypothetical protein F5X99DRAFT_413934 [Biscogniauxia marginata]|nr:hypothetical protein F5X99DRAFT_413934 [Biscogniauxia marginata]
MTSLMPSHQRNLKASTQQHGTRRILAPGCRRRRSPLVSSIESREDASEHTEFAALPATPTSTTALSSPEATSRHDGIANAQQLAAPPPPPSRGFVAPPTPGSVAARDGHGSGPVPGGLENRQRERRRQAVEKSVLMRWPWYFRLEYWAGLVGIAAFMHQVFVTWVWPRFNQNQ